MHEETRFYESLLSIGGIRRLDNHDPLWSIVFSYSREFDHANFDFTKFIEDLIVNGPKTGNFLTFIENTATLLKQSLSFLREAHSDSIGQIPKQTCFALYMLSVVVKILSSRLSYEALLSSMFDLSQSFPCCFSSVHHDSLFQTLVLDIFSLFSMCQSR